MKNCSLDAFELKITSDLVKFKALETKLRSRR